MAGAFRNEGAPSPRSAARTPRARMRSPLTLAVDVGTTSAKVALFDARGRRTLLLRETLPLRRLAGGGAEQDPEDYVRAARRLLRRAEAQAPRAARFTRAGIACQRSTVVVWERASGQPIGPAVTWMDRRAAALVARLGKSAAAVSRRTGLRLSAHYSAAHLARRFAAEPALARAARRGEIIAGPVASFVLARLTEAPGRAVCDPTLAQRMSLYDPRRGLWDPWLCDLFGVPESCLPEVRPSGGPCGVLRLGAREVPVLALAGDQQCAAAAFELDARAGAALVHYGTGAFCLSPAAPRAGAGEGLLLSVRADRRGFYREGTVQAAGAALDAIAGAIGRARLRRLLAPRSAPPAPGPETALLVPAFAGLGAPFWDDGARPVLVAEAPPSPAELVEAALLGIAHRVTDCLSAASGPRRGGDVILSGPLASIAALARFQADVSGLPVRLAQEPEATLLGAARIAARAHGDQPAPAARAGRRIMPRTTAEERRALRARWSAALAASRGRED
jgi:glycerol kinase